MQGREPTWHISAQRSPVLLVDGNELVSSTLFASWPAVQNREAKFLDRRGLPDGDPEPGLPYDVAFANELGLPVARAE